VIIKALCQPLNRWAEPDNNISKGECIVNNQERETHVSYKFPDGFWWGSAASATQTEGASNVDGKGKNIWDHWFELEPNRFFDGVGPENTSQFYYKYKEDIALMKQIGHNSFRMSISWARLFP